jgi:V8-like Glu-specific endopeptidase
MLFRNSPGSEQNAKTFSEHALAPENLAPETEFSQFQLEDSSAHESLFHSKSAGEIAGETECMFEFELSEETISGLRRNTPGREERSLDAADAFQGALRLQDAKTRSAKLLGFDPYEPIREALSSDHADLPAEEVTLVLGRMPAAIVLQRLLDSREMRQATLASLLGKSARRSVRVNGAEVSVPAFLRAVSDLCRAVAGGSEREASESFAGSDRENEFHFPPLLHEEVVDPSAPPKEMIAALDAKNWGLALRLAIQSGKRDENELTNLIFFAKHPELPRAKLDPRNPNFKQLSGEWSRLLNGDVWNAIQASSENTSLVVAGSEVADHDRFFWGASGKRLKQLVEAAAKAVDINPGLLGAIMMSETRRPQSYLSSEKVSSYHIGTDDFYEGRAAIAARVPAYAKVKWNKNQTPMVHDNDAQTPRQVASILFDSGPDAVLATAVYLKFREVRLREIARDLKGDFDRLPVETKFALTRMAMAAGTAGATPFLKAALAGKDILIRKAIPVKIYQTQRNATVRTAQALHLSDWIFGVRPPASSPATHESEGDLASGEVAYETPGYPGEQETEFEEMPFASAGREEGADFDAETGKFGAGTRKRATNTTEIPFRWICSIAATRRVSTASHEEHRGLAPAGTGVLISPCHVLTAAHVLKSVEKDDQGTVTEAHEAETVQITPGRDEGGAPFGTFDVKSWVLHPKWDPKKADPSTDFAVITLDTCIGEQKFNILKGRPFGFWQVDIPPASIRAGLIGGTVMTAGYPESKKKQMWCFSGQASTGSVQVDTQLIKSRQVAEWVKRNLTFRLTADAEKGQSGSPVWVADRDKRYLVGILVDAGSQYNVATTINDDVIRQLQKWIGQGASAHEIHEETETSAEASEFQVESESQPEVETPFIGQVEILESIQEFEDKPPAGLVLLDHMHIPKSPDPKVPDGFQTGKVAVMTPSAMNPGFIDPQDELRTDRGGTGLQTCLEKAIADRFSKLLANRTATKPSGRDRVRIALVDLTGEKLGRPEFAGWDSTVAMYGASSAKILAVYAAFQLRKDIRQMAEDQAIPTGTELKAFAMEAWKAKKLSRDVPDLAWLFDIAHWSAKPAELDFTAEVRMALAGIVHNEQASRLIRRIGFPYIASVAWQSGLRHPVRGGLWLSRAYDGKDGWANNPAMKAPAFIHNITALSVATFFTLLAQGRLVDDTASAEIKAVLSQGCQTCLFPSEITLEASKCGIFKPYMHDCVLVAHSGRRFAAGILTEIDAAWPGWPGNPKCPTGEETALYTDLCRAMDALILNNNRRPKSVCG